RPSPGHQQRWNDNDKRCCGDQALAAEYVRERAGERGGQRDSRARGGDQGADLAGADAELVRQLRQERLWRIEIDESGEARGRDRERAEIESHAALWGRQSTQTHLPADI